ncbi:MAG: hypothetical protein ACREQI_09915 [Candidatus Binataceae bacterium]
MRTIIPAESARRRQSGLPRFLALPILAAGLAIALPAHTAAAAGFGRPKPNVLRVGTWRGIPGGFSTIQSAVDAAKPGDWILVGPGDYHERGDYEYPWSPSGGGSVYITTPKIHLRGMDRNGVVVDGTMPGAAECSSNPSDQDFGYEGEGRNGVMVWKAGGVSVENLTACNFLTGSYGAGNQIWWNGGDGSGQIGLGRYFGQYLSATTTYYQDGQPQGEYGIFVSNASGPGKIIHTYASNMADSGFYIGACPNCNAKLIDAHAENSALGYSGSNSGGYLMIANSEFDQNKTGISTNSQLGDPPQPQSGACPDNKRGPHHDGVCTYFAHNYIHDNNNPNVPESGSADFGPVGTGMVVAGGRFDAIAGNRVENNGAWGLMLVPYPDTGTIDTLNNCNGGDILGPDSPSPLNILYELGVTCFFDDWGSHVYKNYLSGNGFFGNPTNGDLGDLSNMEDPGNCWYKNLDPNGLTTTPANLQETNGTCGVPNHGEELSLTDPFVLQVICATGVFGPGFCPAGTNYPQPTGVVLMPLPPQKTMPNPCAGVPSNPWCPRT